MELLLLLINVAAAATLLLWAVRMVRTGFERANGFSFRRAIQRSRSNRFVAATIGTVLAIMLQSSTAVAVLAAGFASSSLITFVPGMALLLGADLGSALVAQLLSFKMEWLTPFCMLIGGSLFLKGSTGTIRQTGRIILGIGLILLSLRLIGEATQPLRESGFVLVTVEYLANDMVLSFLVGVITAWLLHSSVASVLLVATLVSQSIIPASVGFAVIIGINLGAGLIAFGLTRGQNVLGRRIVIGNLVFRSVAAVVVLAVLSDIELPAAATPAISASWMVYAHVSFNAALLVVCLPLVGLMEKFTKLLMPIPVEPKGQLDSLINRPTALDRSVLGVPQLALASATRECLRMSDIIELMLRPVMSFYDNSNEIAMQEIRKLDESVNQLHSTIKLYLAELADDSMTEQDVNRKIELMNFSINMEAVGDAVSKNLIKLAERKHRDNLTFSKEGWNELSDLHKQVVSNMQLALNTLVSGDLSSARQLVEEKDRMREQERHSSNQHLLRLQSGSTNSVETSDIHLETLRALRQINSMFASGAYPILSQNGVLLNSRLAQK